MIGPTVSNISVEDRRVTWRCRDPYERVINPAIGRRSLTTPPFSGHRKGWSGWPLLNLRPINQANSYKFVTHENVRGITSLPLSLSLFLARLFPFSSPSHPFLILLHLLLVFLFFFFHSLIRFLFKKEKEKGRERSRPFPPSGCLRVSFLFQRPAAIRFQSYLLDRLAPTTLSSRLRPFSTCIFIRCVNNYRGHKT